MDEKRRSPHGLPPGVWNGSSSSHLDESESTDQSMQPSKAEEKKWGRKLMKSGAIGSTALISTVALGGELYAGDVTIGPRIASEYIVGETAPQVKPDTIAKVKVELAKPSHVRQFLYGSEVRASQEDFRFIQRQAEARGFEIANYPKLLSEACKTHDLGEFMGLLNAYTLPNYGVKVFFPKNLGIPDMGMGIETFAPSIIQNSENFTPIRDGLLAIMKLYSIIPSKIIRDSELEEIALVGRIKRSDLSYLVAGEANTVTGRMYLGPGIFTNPDRAYDAVHELGHFLDYHFSGLRGMLHDPGISKLNAPDFKYGPSTNYTFGYDISEDYSKIDVGEDKANIYREVLLYVPDYVYSNNQSPAKDKAIYIIAKLEEQYPGFASYINSLTYKKS